MGFLEVFSLVLCDPLFLLCAFRCLMSTPGKGKDASLPLKNSRILELVGGDYALGSTIASYRVFAEVLAIFGEPLYLQCPSPKLQNL